MKTFTITMTNKVILNLKVSGKASCNEDVCTVDEQHLKQTVLNQFGNNKGQQVLTQVNKYLIGSTVPIGGIYPWDLNKIFDLLNISVIFTDENGKQLTFDLNSSGIS